MATPAQWIEGARLRTLPMALAPVVAGSAAAQALHSFDPVRALLALLVALLLQIGVNYANDYSDGIRGTDDDRVGPLRLTGSGAAAPGQVRAAALLCFGLAALAGAALVVLSRQWWFIPVGLSAVLAAWGYTGGRSPYGYRGLGDVFVFVYFGLVAVLGTTLTQAGTLNLEAFVAALSTGLIATALLMANNIRDLPGDREVGKRTLAVRLGDPLARVVFTAEIAVAFALVLFLVPDNPWMLLVLLLLPLAWAPVATVLRVQDRRQLIPVLRQCGVLNVGWAVLFLLAVLLRQWW
ncbi:MULTISPECIES: 1,4-dihydroxy-2-naphthoate polyprenyltransferase [Kocuria]|nr:MULTISPECIES: 1,4-dihydroxy-2-naphthoate polyprenyltransferase [Kocuria]MCC5784900.1 1,4-dihydroxy-2-naphthoate octaprenyltransferase [Kocuria sp. CCUG 69068]NVC24112.1 1,4-dihydroxy-2-naphthoate polyprenyltransferase [Kocuria salina]EYT53559.1 1,4-dihydroxy-2-naphthoate prenyltransferase [Kocuria sp. UCD-OTCP]KHD98151.1 1,4-dihydroxy-2-naphthoate prenyltransferase [Kocuria polaris]MCM3484399.1 1,4-dihydroxy-2-naphthoate polyprenyltransferase [Kocuria rosea]